MSKRHIKGSWSRGLECIKVVGQILKQIDFLIINLRTRNPEILSQKKNFLTVILILNTKEDEGI